MDYRTQSYPHGDDLSNTTSQLSNWDPIPWGRGHAADGSLQLVPSMGRDFELSCDRIHNHTQMGGRLGRMPNRPIHIHHKTSFLEVPEDPAASSDASTKDGAMNRKSSR